MPRKKEVTLRTIADRLGITVHTASKALRGLPGMSEATRRAVRETARALGYETKAQTDGLRAEQIPPHSDGKPRRFVMLVPADQPFYRMQGEGLHRRMHELGHVVTTIVLPTAFDDEETLIEWLDRSGALHVDGLFLSPALSPGIEAMLLRLPMPKVMIGYPPDAAEVDSVIWDVQHAVHQAMDRLYALGHRRILFVGDIQSQRGFVLRWLAFQAACRRLRIPIRDDEHVTTIEGRRIDWLERIAARLPHATAVLCALNEDATWAYAAIRSTGGAVPGTHSVVATDHEIHRTYPETARPILHVSETGERAAELMLRRIGNPLLPYEHVRLKGPFDPSATLSPPPTL